MRTSATSAPTTSTPVPTAPGASASYQEVCPLERIEVEGGVTALIEGAAVAIFRTHDGNVYAISNHDPCSGASVLSRGIVGTRTVEGEEVPFVASPMHKQAFDLRTGRCLDDAEVRVPTYDVCLIDGMVHVAATGPGGSG